MDARNSAAKQSGIKESGSRQRVLRTRMGVMTYLAPSASLNDDAILADLKTEVDACIEAWETRLVLDLNAVSLLNSAAIEQLLDYHERLIRAGGWIKITNASPLVGQILALTGADSSITPLDASNSEDFSTATRAEAPGQRPRRLGDLLVQRGLLSEAQVGEAIKLQNERGRRMGQILVDKGWVSEKDLLAALAEQLSISNVKLAKGLYDPAVATLLPRDVALRLKVLPLFKVKGVLSLATTDPQAMPTFDEVQERTGCSVRPVLASREDIVKTVAEAFEDSGFAPELFDAVDDDFEVMESSLPDDYSTIDEMAAGSPVINLVNSLIQRAVHDGASDVHIEPSRSRCRVRFRIDGLLYEVMTPRIELHPALVSRLKVMANLNIAERRLPQDGRIQVHTQGRSVDLRFSSLPGLFGEKVVLRILDKNQTILDINKLGMAARNLGSFKNLLERPNGLILVTGPTGSGKTTSLYAAINYLNSMEKNIVTIEDPVEYQVDIVNQNEVRENIGLTFAKMLKHVLRQDPDIIMVGEIREHETAEIAVQAALTGHLVLSTLHTNDSVGAITRMLEMGVEPYLLSSALIGVMAQRLVRGICPACKTEYIAPPEMVNRFGWQERGTVRLAKGRGCPDCYDSGYKGRMAVHELITTDGDFQRLIIANPSRDQLTDYMASSNTPLLFDDGLERVLEGRTTVEEVSRVVNN